MSDITLSIIDLLLPVVLTLVGAALYYLTLRLRAATAKIESEKARGIAEGLLNRARVEVYSAVQSTAQTYVSDLKERRKDGKLTENDAQEAREKAVATFKASIGEAAYRELQSVVGDLETWLRSEIESAVYSLGKDS